MGSSPADIVLHRLSTTPPTGHLRTASEHDEDTQTDDGREFRVGHILSATTTRGATTNT